jgi:hypothetical protein
VVMEQKHSECVQVGYFIQFFYCCLIHLKISQMHNIARSAVN